MQTTIDEIPVAEGGATVSETPAERKLTKEELLDLVGACATKGDDLTRAEREEYAGQLADLMYPGKPISRNAMVRMLGPTRAERRAMAEELAKRREPARQPPPGKTWYEMIRGQWPGEETDEEIRAWLEEIS